MDTDFHVARVDALQHPKWGSYLGEARLFQVLWDGGRRWEAYLPPSSSFPFPSFQTFLSGASLTPDAVMVDFHVT